MSHSPSPVAPPSRQAVTGANAGGVKQENSNDFAGDYRDDFEDDDIQEEIQSNQDDTDNLAGSGNNYVGGQNANNQTNPHRSTFISESMGGITVSQSLGVDPSVDSLALEDYDHIEPVERVNY